MLLLPRALPSSVSVRAAGAAHLRPAGTECSRHGYISSRRHFWPGPAGVGYKQLGRRWLDAVAAESHHRSHKSQGARVGDRLGLLHQTTGKHSIPLNIDTNRLKAVRVSLPQAIESCPGLRAAACVRDCCRGAAKPQRPVAVSEYSH